MDKNYFLSFAVLTTALFLVSSVFAAGTYSGGDGLSAGTAYRIETASDMQEIGANADDWDKYFVLTANINLSAYTGASFNIIGSETIPFTGVFDGGCHKIDNFTYTSTDTDYIAMFGLVGYGGVIKDLGLTNANIDAGTGGLAGSIAGLNLGNVMNCCSSGTVNGQWYVGGLAGENEGSMTNCYSRCFVFGEWYVGGLVGDNVGSVMHCYSTGDVYGLYSVGGLVGMNVGDAGITNCYSTGSVEGAYSIGGLVGSSGGNAGITNCYSIGYVCGDWYVGGMVGYSISCITNCYFLDPAGPDNGCGWPLIEVAMKQQASFAGWDFDPDSDRGYWINERFDYPRLYCQPFADLDNDGYVNLSDLAIMSAALGTSAGQANYNSACDLAGDTKIDTADLIALAKNWLAGTTP
ncbi:MAG: hypothetical protein K9M75_08210 [Phycisphaerae bacterium]|nr:hypothetical protein [Phycisphaerae bacterium]